VHDRIETCKFGSRKVAQIFTDFVDARGWIAKIAICKEIGIQSDDLVAGSAQNGSGNCVVLSYRAFTLD
jgi:hypothetical protein